MAVKIEIEVEVLPDGTVRLHTHGIKGAKCDEELKPIERSLGRVAEAKRTGEYYEQSTTSTTRGVTGKTK
jgi:hypothetical protein